MQWWDTTVAEPVVARRGSGWACNGGMRRRLNVQWRDAMLEYKICI